MKRNTPASPMHAVIYCRVSPRPDEARDKSVGNEAQEAVCRAHCARLGLVVLSVHRDAFLSGKDSVEERPGLSAAIADVQATPGAVLVAYSVSRLARRQKVLWGILDERDGLGVPFASATEAFESATPLGKAMLGMLSVWAALEADVCSSRTKDALAALRAKGVRLGGLPMPIALVHKVRDVAASMPGASLRAVADALNASGVPSSRRRAWHASSVARALEIAVPCAAE